MRYLLIFLGKNIGSKFNCSISVRKALQRGGFTGGVVVTDGIMSSVADRPHLSCRPSPTARLLHRLRKANNAK